LIISEQENKIELFRADFWGGFLVVFRWVYPIKPTRFWRHIPGCFNPALNTSEMPANSKNTSDVLLSMLGMTELCFATMSAQQDVTWPMGDFTF